MLRLCLVVIVLFTLTSCFQTTPTTSAPPGPPAPTEVVSDVAGLRADYFARTDFTGQSVSRIDRHVVFDWGNIAPAQGLLPGEFSARWQGKLDVPAADSYTFFVTSSGSATLRIDGNVVVSDTPVALNEGLHDIKLEFVKTSEEASLKLEWQSSTLSRDVIAQQYLQPATLYRDELVFAAVVTGTNLLLNSDFESGTSGWVKYGTSTDFTTVTPGRSGTGSALKASGWLWIQQDLPVSSIEATQSYTVRGFARALSGGTCTIGLAGGSTTTQLFNETVQFRSSSFQEGSAVVRVPTGTVWMSVYLSTTQPECQFDDVTLIAGTATTPPPVVNNDLIDNGGFEADFANWGRYGGTSSITTPGRNGTGKALQTSNFAWIQQDLTGTAFKGQPYTLSGYGRSATTGNTCSIGLIAVNASGEIIVNVKLDFSTTAWEQKTLRQDFPRGVAWAGVYTASGSTNCFFDDISLLPVPASPKFTQGEWSSVLSWPLIATHMANLTDGRILAWSSYDVKTFGGRPDLQYTQAVIYNPTNNTFVEVDNPQHDMFCAGLAMLPDGRIFAGGGGDGVNDLRVSVFNGSTWSRLPDMPNRHWYGTAVAMPNGEVYIGYGRGSNLRSDIFRNGSWQTLTGINLTGVSGTSLETPDWYPYLHVSPRGTIFHSGATTTMHELNLSGNGTTINRGNRGTGEVYRQWGNAVMIDKGKILLTGGTPQQTNPGSLKSVILLDINAETPVATRLADMNYTRTYHTTIPLPNGEIFVAGGNGTGVEFTDDQSRLVAEMYSPATNTWRDVAAMSVPRNYHSSGTLLQDGRVLLAGGGLCGTCAANHQDGQIYSPPYLFDRDGNAAVRPVIASAPDVIGYNQSVTVTMESNVTIENFSLIKLSAVTHGMNTDIRRMNVTITSRNGASYTLQTEASNNVMTPGYYFLFAVNDVGVPSVAKILRVQ